jgi:hypothetical protein
MLFDGGRNIKQVQRWLGHHSPAFTLETYVHLMDEGVGSGINLGLELESHVSPNGAGIGQIDPDSILSLPLEQAESPTEVVAAT